MKRLLGEGVEELTLFLELESMVFSPLLHFEVKAFDVDCCHACKSMLEALHRQAPPRDSQHPRANTDSQLTQRATHESKIKYTLLYAKGHSAQPDLIWRKHHTEPDPKSIRVMPLCFWGV